MPSTRDLATAALAGLLLVASLSLAPAALHAQPARTNLRVTEGLHAVQFRLKEGAVEVLLPRDLGVADTISGSLILHTAGPPGKKREKNREKMSRLSVRIGELERPAASTPFGPVAVCARVTGSSLPVLRCEGFREDAADGQHRLPVQLLNRKGKVILETRLPVAATPEPSTSRFTYLPLGKAGQPLEILGPFDGNVSTTRVSLGGHLATPLAESPRRTVVRSPLSILGRTRLELSENGTSRVGPFRNLAVLLRFAKPMLQAGERTIVEIVVNGLDDLEGELSLQLVSLTPESAGLERGPRLPLVIHPREVQGGGVYPWVGTLVGVSPAPIDLEVQVEGARPREQLSEAAPP